MMQGNETMRLLLTMATNMTGLNFSLKPLSMICIPRVLKRKGPLLFCSGISQINIIYPEYKEQVGSLTDFWAKERLLAVY